MTNIPTIIDFARKMSKTAKEVDKRVERAKEALACLIKHPGLIKFLDNQLLNNGSVHIVLQEFWKY
jgi:hypothetical protein